MTNRMRHLPTVTVQRVTAALVVDGMIRDAGPWINRAVESRSRHSIRQPRA
jgi:hypothetical protein